MKKNIKYCVIGGQYKYIYYGGTTTLLGAKRLATKHVEYWDNYVGWIRPNIYRAEDTVENDGNRYPKLEDGGRIPPICYYDRSSNRWIELGVAD